MSILAMQCIILCKSKQAISIQIPQNKDKDNGEEQIIFIVTQEKVQISIIFYNNSTLTKLIFILFNYILCKIFF